MKNVRVALILLAAGESKRMGTPKQLLFYRGVSLIDRALDGALQSNCNRLILVVGANSDLICSQIKDLPIQIAYNSQWQQGMSTSISTGINTLLQTQIDFDAFIIALVDQPLITARVYDRLIERYYANNCLAVASNYSNTIGVPALFDRTLVPELLNMKHRGGAKQLLKKYSDLTLNLDLPEAAIDIDTPADYQRLLKI